MCVGGLESTVSNLFLDSFLWYKLLEGISSARTTRLHHVVMEETDDRDNIKCYGAMFVTNTRIRENMYRGLGVTHQRDVAATVLSRGSRDNSITRGHQSGAALLPGGSFQWPARDVICDEDGVVGYVQG